METMEENLRQFPDKCKNEPNRGAWGFVSTVKWEGCTVAVKRIHELLHKGRSEEEVLGNFQKECKRLQAMRHPHVVRFIGAFNNREVRPILVMETMEENLRQFLDKYKKLQKLQLQKPLSISLEIIQGLACLHQQTPPLVHRDLSDKNVMISFEGVVKIGDFAQSKLKDLYLTSDQPGMLCFMPPEALNVESKYNESLDVGVVMLEIGTQQEPLVNLRVKDVIREVDRCKWDLKALREDHPLRPLTLFCLKDNPKERPKASDLQRDVDGGVEAMMDNVSHGVTALRAEKNYVAERLTKEKAPHLDKLKGYYTSSPVIEDNPLLCTSTEDYVKLNLIQHRWHFPKAEQDKTFASVNLCKEGVEEVPSQRVPLKYEDIFNFQPHEGDSRRRILVEGVPGSGKSTLVKQMCRDWANCSFAQGSKLVIQVVLRSLPKRANLTIEDMVLTSVGDNKEAADIAQYVRDCQGNGVVFILDGFDEMSEEMRQSSIVRDILKGHLTPKASILITSRPIYAQSLYPLVDRRIEVTGFGEHEVKKYITDYFATSGVLLRSFLTPYALSVAPKADGRSLLFEDSAQRSQNRLSLTFNGVRSFWSSVTGSGSTTRPAAAPHGEHKFLPQDSVIISDRTRRANKLGEGSFAKVFRGEYNGKPCAVKVFKENVLKKELAADIFWGTSEVEVLSKLQHTNIVYGMWLDPHKGRAALVMELCDESLYELIRRFKGKLLPKERKLPVLQDIARGMVYLHSQNIVHGDLRSSNVLLCHSEDQTVAKLADFDMARFLDPDTQHRFTVRFTAEEYLPPEVFDHKEHKDQKKKWARLTPKVDVFCFGEVVLEMGCGTYPTPTGKFRGQETLTEQQRREKYLVKLKQSDKESLGSIIRKCLADAPEGRPSFTEILVEVDGYLHKYGERPDLEVLQDKTAECEALRAEAMKWEDDAKSLCAMQDAACEVLRAGAIKWEESAKRLDSMQDRHFITRETVCIIGNAESGKSTFIAALQAESNSCLSKIVNRFRRVDSYHQRTAGIEAVTHCSQKYKEVLFYDFAGQHEYHGPDQMFLESLLSTPGESMMLVTKMKEEEDAILRQHHRWLTQVALIGTPATPPQVIVVGSFLDKVKSKEEASAKLMQHYEEAIQQHCCSVWLNGIKWKSLVWFPVLNAYVSGQLQRKAYDQQFQFYTDMMVTSDSSCNLHFAVEVGNVGLVGGSVLSTGCEIHDGRNPTHSVIPNGGSKGTLEIIKLGADETILASAFDTPLHQAELSDAVSTVKSLLKLGCSVDVVDRNGRGVSHSADADSKAELIGELLIAEADIINATGNYNCEPLADVKLDGGNRMICRCDIQTAYHVCSHLQELPVHSLAIELMLPFDVKTDDELEICDPVYPIALSQCSHAQEEQEIMCDDGIIVPKRVSLSLVHEEVLDKVCFSFELKTLRMTSTGGVFTLEPHGINIEVPPGAVSPSESVDLRYGVIVDGPFTLPEGYKLGSMVVYLYYDGRRLTKPITLSLPHWYGGEDQVRDGLSFAMAPHTLKEEENSYRFQLLEGGRFEERGTGSLQIDGHCTLFAIVFKQEAISRYLASFWQNKENGTHYRAAITYDCSTWFEILQMYYRNFVYCDESATFVFSDEESCCGELSQHDGPGWKASISGLSKVSPVDVEFHTKFTESTLKQEVVHHLYPPAINVVVQYERPPEPNCTRSSVHLYIDGPKEGPVNFPFEVFNINPVGLCNEAACALLTHTPEYELKATAMDRGNSRQHVELLKEFLDVISSELDVKEKGRATIEERLKKTEQDLKAKEKECYAFETAQLDLLQQVEELKREKQLLEAREMQRDAELVQMRGELAKAEAACGQLEKLAAMKEENEALKHWQKKAKKVDELENQLNKQGIEFATERRACVELQERLEREVVAKTNLERERDSAVERAECLQAQLIEMHTDLQKLRKVQVLKLYERTCFIEELKESEQQLKDEVKALKRKMQHIEEQLEATRQHLKAKEEECYAFESTQLDLLQQVEELKFPSGEHKSELVQLREELKAKDDAVREMYSKVKELHVVKAQLEATLVNYEANKNQLESAQLLKFKALSERDRYMEMTSTLQEKLLDKEEAKMACEKEIHILRRELEATKKRYQHLKDEKETLVDQQFVDLDDLRSRFSALQSELEAVREEHDVVKLHRYLYNSNLRQMVSEHLHMRDKLLVVVKDSLDTMQEKIIHNVKDFTGLDTAQETVAEHVKEAESQYKAAEKELRKLERVAENYRRKLLDLPHPTEEQLWHHVVPVVGAKWREVATYLGLESHVITAVHVDQSSVEDNCLNALLRWMDGAGKQPKTWITVLEAMRLAGFNEPARELEVKIRSNSL